MRLRKELNILAIILALVLAGIFIIPRLKIKDENISIKTPSSQAKTIEAPPEGLVEAYLHSPYRVLVVKKHPTEPYYLVVATERAKEGDYMNDTSCGSIYTEPTCYFFIEPDYHVDAPKTRLVGKYSKPEGGETGGINPDSIAFKDKNRVEFTTSSGDAGLSIEVWWSLNIDTGELTETNRKMQVYDE